MRFLKINKFVVAILVVTLSFVSCDDFGDLNVDPNSPTLVPASNLVTQAQYSLYNLQHSRVLNAEWGMLMVQHWSQNEYGEESRYLVDVNSFNGTWITLYAGILNELSVARNFVLEDPNIAPERQANQVAVIDIVMADAFQTATDFWGAIPYSEAINPEFPNPCYDAQPEVYSGLLSNLDAAISSINTGTGSFESGDIIFGGDTEKWKKLGASLLLRMAMRISDVDSGTASTYVSKAISYGVLQSGEDVTFGFNSDPNLANPLYIDNSLNNRDDFAVSEQLVTTLTAMGDPRLAAFAALTPSGTIVGMPYGLPDADAFALKSTTSRPNIAVRSPTSPHAIMDYAEVSFLMAEAIERGYTSGDAAQWYANGVTSSMNYWGITEGIDGYLAANPYDAANWKQSIGMQKWIAFYMNGIQAWAEQRRLDVPNLPLPAAASIPMIPVRLPYPISEDTNNGECLSSATSNPNDLMGKLWWDVN